MNKWLLSGGFGLALATAGIAPSQAEDERFDIRRFDVSGNTLLPQGQIDRLLSPLTGRQRVYGDVQKALEALEGAYRAAGYGTVQVDVPEQELTNGVVQLRVVNVVVDKIKVVDNQFFSTENVKAALPALKPGATPNLRELSQNVQLANENPARQLEVTLSAGEKEQTVDAKVAVIDKNPHFVALSLDNTGTSATGQLRTGVSYQFANLFERDHVVSLAYTTSPDSPEGVAIHQYSVGYRMPLYSIGDSVDVIFGKSTSTTPSSTPTLGGAIDFVGKGDLFGLRFNHNFPRRGESTSRLVAGYDYRYADTRCSTVDGQPVSIAPPTPPIASCVPYTVQPLSLTYSAATRSTGVQFDYYLGAALNFATGTRYTNITGRVDRYSYLTPGNRDTRDHFLIVRGGAGYLKGFQNDWQLRFAASGQYALSPAVTSEQFGMTGANAVRGFTERAVAADSGAMLISELYSPDLAGKFGMPGNLRVLVFHDIARGFNHLSGPGAPASVGTASAGLGMRAGIGRGFGVRADIARVISAGTSPTEQSGDVRAHVSINIGF